ncbi:MAG: putative quinol monooxygenase [Planctomycetota bacterium]|jgi:quinol monooxygenase YgiN
MSGAPFPQIHFTVEFEVPADFRERFMELATQLERTTATDEPDTLAYQWFWNEDRTRVIVRELFADRAAVLTHFSSAAFNTCLPEITERCVVVRFEVCGDAGEEILGGLKELGAVHYAPWQGFVRAGS